MCICTTISLSSHLADGFFTASATKDTLLKYFYTSAMKGLHDVWETGWGINKIGFQKTCDSRNMYILAQIFIVADRVWRGVEGQGGKT